MARTKIALADGRYVLVGYDRPFHTYYAMLYDPATDRAKRRKADEPDKAVGYHPLERSPFEITEHGPYPADIGTVSKTLEDWGVSAGDRQAICTIAMCDPDAPKEER